MAPDAKPLTKRNKITADLADCIVLLARGGIDAASLAARLRGVADECDGGAQAHLPGISSPLEEAVRKQDAIIAEVFALWQSLCDHPKARLTSERETKARARMAEGYDRDRLLAAVRGCASSAWHKENGHNDFELIFRDGTHLERFEKMAAEGGGPSLEDDEEDERLRKLGESPGAT